MQMLKSASIGYDKLWGLKDKIDEAGMGTGDSCYFGDNYKKMSTQAPYLAAANIAAKSFPVEVAALKTKMGACLAKIEDGKSRWNKQN